MHRGTSPINCHREAQNQGTRLQRQTPTEEKNKNQTPTGTRKEQNTRLFVTKSVYPNLHAYYIYIDPFCSSLQAQEEANRWTMTYHWRDLDQQLRNSDLYRRSKLVIQTNRYTLGRRKIWIARELWRKKKKEERKSMGMQNTNSYKLSMKNDKTKQLCASD